MANLIARKLRGTVTGGSFGAGNGTAALKLGVELSRAYNELVDKHNALVREFEEFKARTPAAVPGGESNG